MNGERCGCNGGMDGVWVGLLSGMLREIVEVFYTLVVFVVHSLVMQDWER